MLFNTPGEREPPTKTLAFSASVRDLHPVQRPAPEQVKFPPHAVGVGETQTPLLQAGAATRWPLEQEAAPQVLVGNTHFPAAPQIPAHNGLVPAQSEFAQQLPAGMHAPLQRLKPVTQPQTPAPAQVKLIPQGTGAGNTHNPLEQVPAATRLVPEQAGVPHELVG